MMGWRGLFQRRRQPHPDLGRVALPHMAAAAPSAADALGAVREAGGHVAEAVQQVRATALAGMLTAEALSATLAEIDAVVVAYAALPIGSVTPVDAVIEHLKGIRTIVADAHRRAEKLRVG